MGAILLLPLGSGPLGRIRPIGHWIIMARVRRIPRGITIVWRRIPSVAVRIKIGGLLRIRIWLRRIPLRLPVPPFRVLPIGRVRVGGLRHIIRIIPWGIRPIRRGVVRRIIR